MAHQPLPSLDQAFAQAGDRDARQTIRIVHIFISGKTREDRLAKDARKSVSAVAPCPEIGAQAGGHLGQTESIVQFPMQQQAAGGVDRGVSKFHLHRPVEIQPERPPFCFTRRVRC